MGLAGESGIAVTLLNLGEISVSHSNVSSVIGDARSMPQFGDGEFDFVFCNSVIEHVGGDSDVLAMAKEIRRVGRRYYVQTPNRYFPIEPHFLFPFFQFLPLRARVLLLRRFNLGWMKRRSDAAAAEKAVRSINLLSKKQMKALFPDARIVEERLFGLTKSILCMKISQ